MSEATALLRLIAETLRIDVDQLTPNARFDELGRTSFQEIELLTEIEDQFNVKLDFPTYSMLVTVGELVDAVTRQCVGHAVSAPDIKVSGGAVSTSS